MIVSKLFYRLESVDAEEQRLREQHHRSPPDVAADL